jgi:pilus assembly protein CpaB
MNRVQIAVLGVTVLAFGAAYMLFAQGGSPAPQIVKITQKVDTDEVMVAAHEIQMGTKLVDGDFKWQEWPQAAISPLMIRKSEGAAGEDLAKEAVTRSPFLQGEPLRKDKIIKGANGGFLSAILPSGMRAVAINIDQSGSTTAGGFILPNDRVDVLLTKHLKDTAHPGAPDVIHTEVILTNIRVLAIDQAPKEKDGQNALVGKTVTLELKPEQTATLAAARQGGTLSLALRSIVDAKQVAEVRDDRGNRGETINVVRYGIPSPATIQK